MDPVSCTRDTTRLDECSKQPLGVSIETRNHSLKIIYQRLSPPQQKPSQFRHTTLGLVLGALIMLGTLGYGIAPLGGLVLAALIVVAVWRAGGSDADDR